MMEVDNQELTEQVSNIVEQADYSTILVTVAALIICLIAIKVILKLLRKGLEVSKVKENVSSMVISIAKFVLYVVLILVVASTLGINTNSIIALVSVLSLGIALAAEDVISNIAGGMIIRSTNPFKIGDYIKVGNFEGNVKALTLSHTHLYDLAGSKRKAGTTGVDFRLCAK